MDGNGTTERPRPAPTTGRSSEVEHSAWDREAAGSKPAVPTSYFRDPAVPIGVIYAGSSLSLDDVRDMLEIWRQRHQQD